VVETLSGAEKQRAPGTAPQELAPATGDGEEHEMDHRRSTHMETPRAHMRPGQLVARKIDAGKLYAHDAPEKNPRTPNA